MDILNSTLFQKAISTLTALQNHGVKFKVITPTGQEFGELEVVKEKVRTRVVSKLRPMGTIRKYISPFLEDMKAGEIRVVPMTNDIPDFNSKKLLSSISGYCCQKWGNGHAVVAPTADGGVEVLRVEPDNQIPLLKNIETVESNKYEGFIKNMFQQNQK
jgi:hypothetical protein